VTEPDNRPEGYRRGFTIGVKIGGSMEIWISAFSLFLSLCLAVLYIRDRDRASFELESSYANSLLDWHLEVVRILVRLRREQDADSAQKWGGLSELSALIEQGRFFFPNINRGDDLGKEKPLAYQGYRNLALDFLVASYNLLGQDRSSERDAGAETLQRHFTSIVFETVRPQDRLKRIHGLTDKHFELPRSFEDFLNHPDGALLHNIWKRS
jgi:hypothetical protein